MANKLINSLPDIKSGFLVFLIALPLCLAISVASGFPPSSGIITAIIGGILCSYFGGCNLSIKGPAAGLIVIVIASVMELGNGNMIEGYQKTLAVGVVAALMQIIFAKLKVAGLGISISKSVVRGMLSAIGIIIIAKQIHILFGVKPKSIDIIPLFFEIPNSIFIANPIISSIGIISILILIITPKLTITKNIPPQIIILILIIPSSLFLSNLNMIDSKDLIQLPSSLLLAINFPDFSDIFSAISIKYIIMFSIIGTIESTLSVIAIDEMSKTPKSNLNRDLLAVGLGNLISALIGGLPMISEIIRSKANIDSGAKSSKSNFSHGLFLIIFVSLIPNILSLIPLSALAAMLIYTGFRLVSPSHISDLKKIGSDQLWIFSATLITTLITDLLIGVATGILVKIMLHLMRGATIKSLFFTKIKHIQNKDEITFKMYGTAAFPNLLHLSQAFNYLQPNIKKVIIDLNQVNLIDGTFLEGVSTILSERSTADLKIIGLEKFHQLSDHQYSTRWKKTNQM